MSDENTTPLTGAEDTEGTPNGAPEGQVPGEQENGSQKPIPREMRYRLERNQAREALAEAEAQFADLQARLERAQLAEVHRLAGEVIANPEDLLKLTERELAEFLSEGGGVDAEKVTEAATELLSTRPGLRKNTPAFDPSQGRGGTPPAKPKLSWGDLLNS